MESSSSTDQQMAATEALKSHSPRSEHSGDDSHGSGLKLGLFGPGGAGGSSSGFGATSGEDEYDEDDGLEKEFQHEDDADLLAYQRSKSTPKIIVQEFEGEDERSAEFKKE